MPGPDIRPFTKNSNVDILNAIRKTSSSAFQSRIPESTKANVQQNLQNLTKYRPLYNEFVDALINRIGLVLFQNQIWSNPLAIFKRGLLEYGDTIEEINVGLIKSRVYNADRLNLERDIYGNYPPDVQASYHTINRKEYYPLTINDMLLRRAFLTPDGLSKFISDAMSALSTSDNWDEFLLTTSLFREYYRAGGFFKVQVPNVSDPASTEAQAKVLLRATRSMAETLQFLSTNYNAAGMPIAVKPEDLILITTPDALAAIDVEALAGAFNIEKANMAGRTVVIPHEQFGIPGVQAILTTKYFFVIADAFLETTSQFNPVSVANNYFLHHQEVISASRFAPAILFTTEAGTVLPSNEPAITGMGTVTVTDETGATVTSVTRGTKYQVIAAATPNGVTDDVRLEVSGALSRHTFVTQDGVLHVGPEDESISLTVTAYAINSDLDVNAETTQISGSVTVAVIGDLLNLWPNPSVTPDADADGLLEVTPLNLTMDETTGNVVIPSVKGVKYKKAGTDVANGSTQSVTGTVVFTAVSRDTTKYELATGATASWTFTH